MSLKTVYVTQDEQVEYPWLVNIGLVLNPTFNARFALVLLFALVADAVNELFNVTPPTEAVTLIPKEINVLNIELCRAPALYNVATLVVEL